MKIELKNIEIVMGDKTVKLTIAEAQELRKQLNDLFGEGISAVISYPVYIEREAWPYWKYPTYSTGTPITTTTPTVYCCTG